MCGAPCLAIRYGGIPLIVGLLVSLAGGVICLLLHMVSLAAILGFTIGSFVLVVDNGMFFAYYRTVVYIGALLIALVYTARYPNQSLLTTTAASGALILTLCVDAYGTRSFGALIFQNTILEYAMEVESSVARCFNWRCYILIPFWIVCTLFGFATQYYSQQLRMYEQAWPLLFVAPKRANYTTRSTTRHAESLIAEDRNYTITNYASYETYQKIQTAQQQAQQAQQAALHQQQQTQPSAAPELGSAHADDKVSLPPAPRATFNFIELKRLPPQYQYLYLVIQNSFHGLVRTYGFQVDNMQNQYEHLIFLLSNYQNKPSILATNLAATTSTPSASPTAVMANGDYISQLHTKLFTNYREWIAYMNLGGNSTVGGSAITTDVVPLVKSQISDEKVDKNTTDAKIEEICLWLLVWGERSAAANTLIASCQSSVLSRARSRRVLT
jgi:hypothetical protein